MAKAKQIAQSADNYGAALDNYFLMWEIENLSLMGSSKYDEILKLTNQYFKKHAELASIGDKDTLLKYHALLKIAPEVISTFDLIDVNNEHVKQITSSRRSLLQDLEKLEDHRCVTLIRTQNLFFTHGLSEPK